jgi:transcriptional regulator with XRE-family HTH domain
MKDNCGNIYRNARKAAGFTQERWAEFLGISPEAVRQYESDVIMPGEEVLLRMADISGLKILPYWHLSRKSRLAASILPELEEQRGLPEAVLGLLIQIENFQDNGMKALIRIAQDGHVAEDELQDFDEAVQQLRDLVRSAYALGYAKD